MADRGPLTRIIEFPASVGGSLRSAPGTAAAARPRSSVPVGVTFLLLQIPLSFARSCRRDLQPVAGRAALPGRSCARFRSHDTSLVGTEGNAPVRGRVSHFSPE